MMKQNVRRTEAFTLIELLVVIGIIALLAAILLPAMNAAFVKAEKAQVQAEVNAIKAAVQAFYNDYGKLPIPSGHGSADTEYTDSKPILQILTANSSQFNPRNIVYIESRTNATDGTFLDAWDKQYKVKLDNNYDGKVDNYTVLAIVTSAGPDGNFGTIGNPGDDIVSGK